MEHDLLNWLLGAVAAAGGVLTAAIVILWRENTKQTEKIINQSTLVSEQTQKVTNLIDAEKRCRRRLDKIIKKQEDNAKKQEENAQQLTTIQSQLAQAKQEAQNVKQELVNYKLTQQQLHQENKNTLSEIETRQTQLHQENKATLSVIEKAVKNGGTHASDVKETPNPTPCP